MYGRGSLPVIPFIRRILKACAKSTRVPKRTLNVVFFGALLICPGRLFAQVPASLDLADMTWMEVRAAISAGFTTVIVPSGGLEQNGPHMAIGKHDWIMDAAAHRIAAGVGHALVAPTIAYVPEGETDPPTGNMRFPGTSAYRLRLLKPRSTVSLVASSEPVSTRSVSSRSMVRASRRRPPSRVG